MNISHLLGLLIGLVVGIGFSWMQWRVQLHHERKGTTSRVGLLPGSMTRVAILLAVLGLVQVAFPSASLVWITVGLLTALVLPMALRLKRMMARR